MRPFPSAALAACLCAACGSAPVASPDHAARPVVELARWRVLVDGEERGRVVHLEIQDPVQPLRYYRVEDLHGRWLGHATENGRFSRRVPFQDDEQDLGVWPMARGVAALMEASAPVRLEPVAVEAVGDGTRGVPR